MIKIKLQPPRIATRSLITLVNPQSPSPHPYNIQFQILSIRFIFFIPQLLYSVFIKKFLSYHIPQKKKKKSKKNKKSQLIVLFRFYYIFRRIRVEVAKLSCLYFYLFIYYDYSLFFKPRC